MVEWVRVAGAKNRRSVRTHVLPRRLASQTADSDPGAELRMVLTEPRMPDNATLQGQYPVCELPREMQAPVPSPPVPRAQPTCPHPRSSRPTVRQCPACRCQ